jgi:cysteine-rich repeat protein
MQLYLRLRTQGLAAAVAIAVALAAPRASADVITIDDGGLPGTAAFPFTCSLGEDGELWLPTMGFVYRNVEPFDLAVGDTIAFDLQMRPADPDDLGFRPQLDIALAHASDPAKPFKPDDQAGSDFTIVGHGATASGAGNRSVQDYDLVYTVDTAFHFPGGGLIIRVSNPQGVLATKGSADCLPVITADMMPTGTNRLVGTFKLEAGEYPWTVENTTSVPAVPYVRIRWTRCGDGLVSGSEACDDGNTDDTDGCTNRCLAPACGDGIVQRTEECDNSADPDHPDPFCNDSCQVAAYAKGSGCGAGGGAGLGIIAAVALILLARRRRAAAAAFAVIALHAGSAEAQLMARTDGFRVDRFELAPSVDDGLVVQDPRVLGHMVWSVSAALGYTNTLLRVVPQLSSNTGIDVVGTRLSAYLDFALGLRDRFELDVAVPFALAQATDTGTAAGIMLRRPGATALGDARIGGSVLLYGRSTTPNVGFAASAAIPIGSENSFTSDGTMAGELMATAAFPGRGYRVLVNGGVRLRPRHDYVSTDQGSELLGRAGILVPVAHDRLTTSLEFDLSTRASGPDAFRAIGSPILAILGGRYHFDGGIHAGAAVGAGLTAAPGSPAVRVVFTVGYSPVPEPPRRLTPTANDRDGDGIPDNLDKCPDKPEDVNGVEDDDGCPDAYDRDKDRITDTPPGVPETLEDVVTMPAPIEFKFDTAIMLPGAEAYLHRVLEILQKHTDVLKIEVQGHTSSEGGYDYNMRLSNARARTVLDWLVEHGVAADRLVPHGFGLTQPLFPNDTEEHRQRNRRVQFRILETVPGSDPLGKAPPATAPAKPPETPDASPQPAQPTPPAPTTPPSTSPPSQ